MFTSLCQTVCQSFYVNFMSVFLLFLFDFKVDRFLLPPLCLKVSLVICFIADIRMNTTASTVTEKEYPFSEECESVLQAVGNGHVTHPVFAWVVVTITLTAITVITFLTNVTVLAALTVGRGRPSSYSLSMTLTLSLLTSDLMLSVGVMPFAVYNIVGESWILGKVACRSAAHCITYLSLFPFFNCLFEFILSSPCH